MLRAIEAYQRAFEGRPSPCRFHPTCSEYGRQAIAVHGARHGLWLTVRRLLRCRPFGPSGFDPIPELHHHLAAAELAAHPRAAHLATPAASRKELRSS
jgi:putative membrane protein insertion efficiency factor